MIDISIIIPFKNSIDTLSRLFDSIPENDNIQIILVENCDVPHTKEELGIKRDFELLNAPSFKYAGGVHIHAIEGDGEAVVLLVWRKGEVLAIPSDAARKSTTAGSRRIRWREIALYRPVVSEIQATPMPVGILRILHTGTISQNEKPVFIKRLAIAGAQRLSAQ